MGKLKTYEIELNIEENDHKKVKSVALQGVDKTSLSTPKMSSTIKDEMAMFVKKFRRMHKDKTTCGSIGQFAANFANNQDKYSKGKK